MFKNENSANHSDSPNSGECSLWISQLKFHKTSCEIIKGCQLCAYLKLFLFMFAVLMIFYNQSVQMVELKCFMTPYRGLD